jgi:hypothetical protein
MKKHILAVSILGLMGYLPVAASASEQNGYFELGYSQYMGSSDDGSVSLSIPLITVTLGHNFTPNFAVEGLIGTGVAKDTVRNVSGTGVDVAVGINSVIGMNLKGILPFTDSFSGFAKIGYQRWASEFTVSDGNASVNSSSSNGEALIGAGLQYGISQGKFGTASYTVFNAENGPAGSFNIGLGFNF